MHQDRLIGLMVEPGLDLLAGLLGILKAGRGFVPLDPDHPTERLQLMAEDCRLRVLLTDRKHLARATELAVRCAAVEHVVCLDGDAVSEEVPDCHFRVHGAAAIDAAREAGERPAAKPPENGEGTAYVIYTSGSTGTPKGVPITHRNLVPLLLWSRDYFGFGAHTRVLQSLSYAFDFGVFEILSTLLFGGTFHPLAARSDIAGFLELVERHGINTLHTTPSFFRAVAAAGGDLGRIEILHLGGEALTDPLVDQALAATGECCLLYNGYGPTETTINCAIFRVGTRAAREGRGLPSIPIGRPSADNVLYVLDGGARPVPLGVPGELCIGGVGLSRGYLNRPELTAEKFIPNPLAVASAPEGTWVEGPGSRLYRSGDLVRFRPDGNLEFLGRRDQQVKIRGYRIELGEIETALAGDPALAGGAVVAHRTGAGEPQLVAYVVPASPRDFDAEALRRRLARRLPPYMVPASLVRLAELPVTPTGKLDRQALPAPEEARRQDGSRAARTPPRTPAEELVAAIWCRCLGVDEVGVEDDFFALGGHSLLLTQAISHLRKELGVEVPLHVFFEAPVLADLAAAVERAGRANLPPITPVPRDRDLPLSFAQERLWFLAQLDPGSLAYHVPRIVRITGDYRPPAMELAYGALVERHEILRTVLRTVDGQPVQHILAPRPVRVLEADLAGLPARARHAELERLIAAEVRRPFDLVHGPMLRAVLVRLGAREYTQIQTEHHLVHDGWTQGVLLDDLLALYAGFYEGRRAALRPLPIQYADYAVWQRRWLVGEAMERELAYWRERLVGMPPVLELPTDRPRPPVQSFRGATLFFDYPESVLPAVHGLSRRAGVTTFMTLFGAYATLLHRYSRSLDVVAGTAIANRTHAETEGLIGFFVNTLLLRTDFGGGATVRQLLDRVRATTLGAYAHQQLPFEKLVEDLDPERDLSHTPLCQVFFILQNAPLPPLRLPGVTLEYREVENGTAKFDLSMSLQERNGRLGGWLELNTDLFDTTTIERFRDQLGRLFEAMAAEPERRVAELPLLSPAERLALIAGWNAAPPARRDHPLLHEWFFEQAARRVGDVALVHGGEPTTYGALAARVAGIAARLRGLGLGPEARVGVFLEPGPDLPAALLGVLAAGGAYVPLDPSHPAERLALICADAGMAALLTHSPLAALLPDGARALPQVLLDAPFEGVTLPVPSDAGSAGPDDLAYVIYTSGSTGWPKGVEVPHGALVNFLRSMQQRPGLSEDDVLLAATTVAFDIAALELFLPLVTGAHVILVGRDVASDGRRLAEELAASGATVMQATPATWSLLFEARWPGTPDFKVLCGGEALPRLLADRLLASCGELWNMYGPTETTVWSGVTRVGAGAGPVTVGGPVAGTELHVLESAFEPAPLGVPGELAIGGAGLARGYHGRPDLTAERFVPDPLGGRPGARLYCTGDLARRLPDGRIEFLGRLDHQVKLRGFRIELGEIEAALTGHPGLAECVAVLRDDGAAGPQIVAYVVAAQDGRREPDPEGAVAEWSAVWDDAYRDEAGDPTFDISGWNSSVTGAPLGPAQMGEWVAGTVERILSLEPRQVLEIGCGTGLLLHRIAPCVESYCATDVSPRVVERLRRQVEAPGSGLGHVTVQEARADRMEGFAPGSFDVVLLNSVVQYFPDVDYLLRVLDRLLPLVAPGGAVFLGDIRSLPLLEAFRLEIELARAPEGLPAEELRQRLNGAVAAERELALDPRFFHALARRFPEITGVGLQLKPGRFRNELTKYRYDVVLRLGGDPAAAPEEAIDWPEAGLAAAGLRACLAGLAERAVSVRRIPNARLGHDLAALRLLHEGRVATAGALREVARRPDGDDALDPQDLWELAGELGRLVAVSWSAGAGAEGLCDAFFLPADAAPAMATFPPAALPAEPWSRYANTPCAAAPARHLAPELAGHLRDRLPSYMVPAAFVFLDALPLTPSGKVDRRALPAPGREARAAYRVPSAGSEERLAQIWFEILGIDRIGADDSFFALGGHSLVATRLMSRVRQRLGVDLPLRTLFEAPTVAGLAERIDRARVEERVAEADFIRPVARGAEASLSFAQERLWFLDQLAPGSPFYNLPGAFRLRGDLAVPVFERALAEVVRRHEVLRTTFGVLAGRPVQIVAPAEAETLPCLPVVDLAGLPEPQRGAEWLRLLQAEARRPFELTRGPLLRACLLRSAAGDHTAAVTLHHIVSDGWSLGVLLQEMAELYRAFSRGESSSLPELPIQYADFACWQRSWLQGEELARQLAYWRRQLAGLPERLELPADRPRPAVQGFRGRRLPVDLSAAPVHALEELSRGQGATLFMALLATFAALLHRFTHADDLAVGSPVANRNRPEIEGLIGFFVNALVLRVDLAGEPSFVDLLGRVRESTLEAQAHQDLPFERLVEELQPARSLSHTPLFQAVLALHPPAPPLAVHGLVLEPLSVDSGTAKFDLTLTLAPRDGTLHGYAEYSTELFDAATVERLLRHFQALLAGAAADPRACPLALPLLAPDELRQVLAWNNTSREIPATTLSDLVAVQAAERPGDPAVESAGERLTYADLDRRAGRLARRLRALGVGPERVVAVLLDRSTETAVAALAAFKAGGAYLPLDPASPPERLGWMLEDSGAAAVVTSSALAELLPANRVPVLCLDAPAERNEIERPGEAAIVGGAGPEHLAYLVYTSGSTGRPKAVAVGHRALVNLVEWHRRAYDLGPGDRCTLLAGPAFDAAVWELWACLGAGATLCIPDESTRLAPGALAAWLAGAGVTVCFLPTPLAEAVLAEWPPAGVAESRLRALLTGGDRLHRLAACPPSCQVINHYGPTESAVVATAGAVRPGGEREPAIGRPITNTRVHLLDRRLLPVPVGVAAELHIAGDGLARGYAGRPALTAESFVPDPFGAAGTRMYRSGDIGRYLPGGEIEFLGRRDQQVKIRGFRVEPGEIESSLATHPAVREAAVLALGEGAGRGLVAFAVARNPAAVEPSGLRAFLQTRLPDFMVPGRILVLADLPLTLNGKVDRRALAGLDLAGGEEAYASPRTPVEQALVEIWQSVLGRARVGIRDDFFALGGHSMVAMQVVSQVRETFGLPEFSLRRLFQEPTIEQLALVVTQAQAESADALEVESLIAELQGLSPAQAALLLQSEE